MGVFMSLIIDDDIVVFVQAKGFSDDAPDDVGLIKVRLYRRQVSGGREYRRIGIYHQNVVVMESEVFMGWSEYENARDLFLQIVSGGDKITPQYLGRLLAH